MASLSDLFNQYRKAYPALLDGAIPVAHGTHGLLVSHNDGTVMKIAHTYWRAEQGRLSMAHSFNEIAILRHMATKPDAKGIFPQLVDEPIMLSGPATIAYRMTRIPGVTKSWGGTESIFLRRKWSPYFSGLGRLIAHFHLLGGDIPVGVLSEAPNHKDFSNGKYPILTDFTDVVNEALAVAAKYLVGNITKDFLHGDVWHGNVLSQDGLPSGLIDYGQVVAKGNRMIDFVGVPQDHVAKMLAGYKDISGKSIDTVALDATLALSFADRIQQKADTAADQSMNVYEFRECLKRLRPLTGYKPPFNIRKRLSV